MINYTINKPCNYPVDYNGTEEVVYPANTIPIPTPLSIKYGDNPVQDDEFLYRQTAKGVHVSEETSKAVAQLDTIKGKSLVWNQLCSNVEAGSSTTGTNIEHGIKLTSEGLYVQLRQYISTTPTIGHKYYSTFYSIPISKGIQDYIDLSGKIFGISIVRRNIPFGKYSYIFELQNNPSNSYITHTCICKVEGETMPLEVDFINNSTIDLTLMFGAGNEPATVEEFEKMFPLDYYNYNPGEIICNTAEYIESVGFNQYNSKSGKAKVLKGVTYYVGGTYTSLAYSDGTAITVSSNLFTADRTDDITVTGGNATDTVINISNIDRNGTYEPYEKHVLSLDVSKWKDKQGNLVFPYGGMHGVGTAYDYAKVDADGYIRKVVRCFEQVDLGTIDYRKDISLSGVDRFVFTLTNSTYVISSDNVSNIICWKFATSDISSANNNLKTNIVTKFHDQCYVYITSGTYSTASDFKAAMSGVKLYYELATPVEVELATPINVLKDRRIGDAPVGRVYIGTNKIWETEDWYGIKWTEDNSVSTDYIQRIGNPTLHQTLPLLSMMRRCMVQDDGTVYKYISDTNPLLYEDGTTANYDGTDGQVMVEIPAYHHESYQATENGVVWNYLKLYPNVKLGVTSPKCYYGAFEMMQDNSNNSTAKGSSVSILDLTTMGVDSSTTSINAADVKYISGKENYRNYDYNNTDTTSVKCSYGRATTNRDRATFRTIAANRGTRWSLRSWDAYCSLLRLYAVEYCNFDAQLAFNPNTTAEGYKQGGLGAGVTTTGSATWDSFNAYHSFVPCGTTISLGNKTGNISYVFAANEFSSSAITFSVPSYRGIENPFGHIWEFIDGFNRMGVTGNKENIYVCHDVTKFAENAATGYELISNTAARATGDIAGISWDKSGTFWPKPGGRTIYGDYFYNAYTNNTWYTLCAGGSAANGATAGLLSLYGGSAAASASASIGSRLLYTPSEN